MKDLAARGIEHVGQPQEEPVFIGYFVKRLFDSEENSKRAKSQNNAWEETRQQHSTYDDKAKMFVRAQI